ncbi:hypothetical protein MTO96_049320 [Rhipicephalus appendiculatus]
MPAKIPASGTLGGVAPIHNRNSVSSYIPTLGNLVFVCLVPFLILSAAAALVFYIKAKPQQGQQAAHVMSPVTERDSVNKLQSAAQGPRRDVYLALAGPGTPSSVASETASSTRYRTQLCEGLEDVLEDLDLQGAMFNWPSPYSDTLGDAKVAQQFFSAMETCLGAFSKKMALVVPSDEGDRKQFFPFIDGVRHSYNVVYWTHNLHEIDGHDTLARCTVNLPDILDLQTDLKNTTPALHDQAIVTVSLRALKFHLLVTTGPNKLSSAEPNKTEVLPYTTVCRETVPNQSQWQWSMSKEDGCVHGTYQDWWMASLHEASDIYFANFTTGVAIFRHSLRRLRGHLQSKVPPDDQ